MLRRLNIRIGTKLAIMSAIAITLVIAMIAVLIMGDKVTRAANEMSLRQALIARNMVDAKASERGMQMGVRDIRLATSKEALEKAKAYLVARHKSVTKFINETLPLSSSKENGDRMRLAKSLGDQYLAGAEEIEKIREKVISLRAAGTADAVKEAAQLADQAERIAREKTLPLATKFEATLNEIVAFAIKRSEVAVEEARHDMEQAELYSLATGALAILVLIGSAVFGVISIARPLRKMSGVLVELTNDRVVDVPYTKRGDEIGEIAKATEIFKQSIAEKVTNYRVRLALDEVRTNVMLADADYNIIYMNKTIVEMMKEAETDLRKDVPALDVNKLIGTCIDVFHKNPAHQRKILDNLSQTIETDLNVGGRNFHLVVTPVIQQGTQQRLGTIVEWQDLTKIKAQERISTRIRSALDGCATNMMVADENYNIIYMNDTMMAMMQKNETDLRKSLPNLDTKKLIGSCIDVFHKNPAHQRGILDTLDKTIETDLAIAGLDFHLVVSPITDKDGKRLGTSVEWKDETAEKAIEREIDGVVQAAVAGDFSQRVPAEGKQGFMLKLTNAMNGLCQDTGRALDDLARMMGALAEGDLTPRITAEYQGMFGKLKADANMMADRIGSTIGEIKSSAREVTNAAAEISTSTTDLSQRTEEQAASLEETSASMEEIAATVKKNAENAQQANTSASGTRDVADRGGKVVAQAVEAMAKIEESSRKISDIIGVIDEIARQTNLLALNAAVEAARAGDAGRGFAVVASEVRSLAQRSSQAAKDIKDLITNSNGQVKDGVDLVNRAGTALSEIVESIKKVAEVVGEIANASAEQAGGIDQVNKALTQMDEVTQQNSALVEENAATAKTLESQAKAMDERVAFFKLFDNLDTAALKETESPSIVAKPPQSAKPAPAKAAHAPVPKSATAPAAKPAPKAAAKPVVKPAPKPAAKPVPASDNPASAPDAVASRGPVGRMQSKLATALKHDPDWEEF